MNKTWTYKLFFGIYYLQSSPRSACWSLHVSHDSLKSGSYKFSPLKTFSPNRESNLRREILLMTVFIRKIKRVFEKVVTYVRCPLHMTRMVVQSELSLFSMMCVGYQILMFSVFNCMSWNIFSKYLKSFFFCQRSDSYCSHSVVVLSEWEIWSEKN